MKARQLIDTPPPTDILSMSDADLEAFFADAGLEVNVVAHCGNANCPRCFAFHPAKAA